PAGLARHKALRPAAAGSHLGQGRRLRSPAGDARPVYGANVDNTYNCIAPDVKLGKDVKLSRFINLYGCEIGDETKIGAFVEIQKRASVGRRCKISSHTFICER